MLSLGLLEHPETRRCLADLLDFWDKSGQGANKERLGALIRPEIEAVEVGMRAWVAEDPENRHFGPPATSRNEYFEEEEDVDPMQALGVAGSIASLISVFQAAGQSINAPTISKEVIRNIRERVDSSDDVGAGVTDEEIGELAVTMVEIFRTDSLYYTHIESMGLKPYRDALASGMSDSRLSEVYMKSRLFICTNISMACRDNGGEFPSEAFRKLFEQFRCALPN
ncbi:MAG TPA: hypothetical protein VMY41_07280 [Thermohalobaculum sp.]|nr:hypothetical protein [Thermohalobaculum sp.]